MLSEGRLFICVQPHLPYKPLWFLSPRVPHWRLLTSCHNSPAVDEQGGISTTGSSCVQSSDWLRACLREGWWLCGWTLEKGCDKRQKRESAEDELTIHDHRKTQGSPLYWHSGFGSGMLDSSSAKGQRLPIQLHCMCVFMPKPELSCLQSSECYFNRQKKWKKTYQCHLFFHVLRLSALMKIWGLITFSSPCFHSVCIVSKTDAKSNPCFCGYRWSRQKGKDISQRQCQQV